MSFLNIKPLKKRKFRNWSMITPLQVGGTPMYSSPIVVALNQTEYTHKAAVAEVERMYPGEPVTCIKLFENGDFVLFTDRHNVTFHSTRKTST